MKTNKSGSIEVALTDDADGHDVRRGRLTVLSGPDTGLRFDIDTRRTSGGRRPINDFVLSDVTVADTHFEVLATDDGYRLRDLDTLSGTFIGDLRVRDVYIQSGMSFRVGDTLVRFDVRLATTMPTDIEPSGADSETGRFRHAIGTSAAMREIFARLERVAPSDLTCLITGDTGTGKGLIAHAIHQASRRRERPFVTLHCGALPKALIESTLFGHEKGAFTGAVARHHGCFEQARGGTIFLDEIGELDLSLQPKLLRVLEQRELKRLGGTQTIDIDVRVLAATHRDLRIGIHDGRFREDLYYRLSVEQIVLPTLRQRRTDILPLADHFLRDVGVRRGMRMSFSQDAIDAMHAYAWPGNVRELRNVVERAAALADNAEISGNDFSILNRRKRTGDPARAVHGAETTSSIEPEWTVTPSSLTQPFKQAKRDVVRAFEFEYLAALIARNQGNISRSAREAGLTRYHLRELLKRHQLTSTS